MLLTIAYDGSGFSGWQRQKGLRTAQGEIERVLSLLCNQEISVDGTSRTDAGVHALDQHASFKGDFSIPVENIPRAANDLLAAGLYTEMEKGYKGKSADIRILEAKEVPMDFHARFNSKGKMYRYLIDTSEECDLFSRNTAYNLGQALDIEAMNEACKYIIGTHDFKAFEAAGSTPRESTVRTIYGLRVFPLGNSGLIAVEVKGDGFLYNMVRIMVGTLVDVGLGKRSAEELPDILESLDRTKAGPTAPAEGLYLAKVYYEEEDLKTWKE